MKTATLDDLQTRLPTVLAWVRGGEDVMVKGEPPAAAPPAVPQAERTVDWTKSAAFRRPRGEPILSQQDLDELFEHMRGPY